MNSSTAAKKPHLLARIREDECIGCGKCLPACPVDAILGSEKYMHTVIMDECIGCKLCLPPCPVDCIDLVMPAEITQPTANKKIHIQKRVRARRERLAKHASTLLPATEKPSLLNKKRYLDAAIARAKAKKQQAQSG